MQFPGPFISLGSINFLVKCAHCNFKQKVEGSLKNFHLHNYLAEEFDYFCMDRNALVKKQKWIGQNGRGRAAKVLPGFFFFLVLRIWILVLQWA